MDKNPANLIEVRSINHVNGHPSLVSTEYTIVGFLVYYRVRVLSERKKLLEETNHDERWWKIFRKNSRNCNGYKFVRWRIRDVCRGAEYNVFVRSILYALVTISYRILSSRLKSETKRMWITSGERRVFCDSIYTMRGGRKTRIEFHKSILSRKRSTAREPVMKLGTPLKQTKIVGTSRDRRDREHTRGAELRVRREEWKRSRLIQRFPITRLPNCKELWEKYKGEEGSGNGERELFGAIVHRELPRWRSLRPAVRVQYIYEEYWFARRASLASFTR